MDRDRFHQADRGTILVSGQGEISVPLERRPRRVEVRFKHHHEPHPCNPHPEDLRWEVREVPHPRHRDRDRYSSWEIMIWWKVNGVQEIEWSVEY